MKKIDLNGKSFEISEISHKFISNYLERIEKRLKNNNQDITLKNDIEERLSEKFGELGGNINDGSVIKIINEIGEPQDIFDTSNVNLINSNKLFRVPDNAIILGVCYGIAKYFNINPIWVRLLFIFLIPLYGFIVVVYLVAALLMPVKYENTKYTKPESGILIRFISIIFTFIFKSIFFVFFVIMGFGILSFSIFFIGIGPLFFSGITIDNMEIFQLIPIYLKISTIGLGASLFIFAIRIMGKSIKKNFVNKTIGQSSLVIFILSIIGFISGLYNVFGNYFGNINDETVLFEQEAGSGSMIYELIGIGEKYKIYNQEIPNKWNSINEISFKHNSNNKIIIKEERNIIIGNELIGKKILENMNKTFIEKNNNNLIIKKEGNSSYKKTVPFVIVMKKLVISIPENIQIDLRNSLEEMAIYKVNNATLANNWYSNIFQGCAYSLIKYDNEKNKFECTKGYEEKNNQQLEYENFLENNIINMNEFPILKYYGIKFEPNYKNYQLRWMGHNWALMNLPYGENNYILSIYFGNNNGIYINYVGVRGMVGNNNGFIIDDLTEKMFEQN